MRGWVKEDGERNVKKEDKRMGKEGDLKRKGVRKGYERLGKEGD